MDEIHSRFSEFSFCLTRTPEICPWCKGKNIVSYDYRGVSLSGYVNTKLFHCNDCEADYGYNPFPRKEDYEAEITLHPVPIVSQIKLDTPPVSIKLPWYKRLFS